MLARLRPISGNGKYEGRTLKRLTDAPGRVLGVYSRAHDRLAAASNPPTGGKRPNGQIVPADLEGAEDGEIVLCIAPTQPQLRPESPPGWWSGSAAWGMPGRSA